MRIIRLILACIAAGLGTSTLAAPQQFAPEIEAFVKADRANPPTPCAILFVGSSSIRMWDSLTADMTPHRVVNRGFGGSTISDVNHYFDRVVAPYRPRAIFFYAGENDIAAGKSRERVKADFQEFLARKTQALGATPVYFISLKPSKARFAQLGQQSRVNADIRRLAAKRSDLHFVDVASAMLHRGKPRDIFLEDALHMTNEGYRIWTRIIRPKVEKAARLRCS